MASAQAAGSSRSVSGVILTPAGWVQGRVEFNERILAVHGGPVHGPGDGPVVLPGFIDLHVHGGGGADLMDGGDAVDVARPAPRPPRHHRPPPHHRRRPPGRAGGGARPEVGPRERQRAPGAARVLGVHLEGPFINPGKLGAQPRAVRPGSLEEVQALDALARCGW